MGTRSDPYRDNFLLETNFDEDGPLTTLSHSGNQNNNHGGGGGDVRQQPIYRSTTSVDRYSDSTLHGVKKRGKQANTQTQFFHTTSLSHFDIDTSL